MATKEKEHWRTWTPWLFSDQLSIGEVAESIPHAPEIPLMVRLFENPRSPLYLPAPTDMKIHDVLHVLLGRGLLNQDEAFVIGFGMGAAKGSSNFSRLVFEFVGTTLYPRPYKFKQKEMLAFHLAFDFAKRNMSEFHGIHLMDYSKIKKISVADLRQQWGLSHDRLIRLYDEERKLLPTTPCTNRLPKK